MKGSRALVLAFGELLRVRRATDRTLVLEVVRPCKRPAVWRAVQGNVQTHAKEWAEERGITFEC